MTTIRNQWVSMCIGTITPNQIESLLGSGPAIDALASTAGLSPNQAEALLTRKITPEALAAAVGISTALLAPLLAKGASIDAIAATAGTSRDWLVHLLAQPIQAGFNGYPTATPTYDSWNGLHWPMNSNQGSRYGDYGSYHSQD